MLYSLNYEMDGDDLDQGYVDAYILAILDMSVI